MVINHFMYAGPNLDVLSRGFEATACKHAV